MKLIEILTTAGVNVQSLGEKFSALCAKHEAKILKALTDNCDLPPLAVVLMTINQEEGINFNLSFPKDEKCSPEAKALKDELGVKDVGFNYKKAALVVGGVAVAAGVSYGGYRYYQSRKSKAAAASAMAA